MSKPQVTITQPADVSQRDALALMYFGVIIPQGDADSWSDGLQVLAVDVPADPSGDTFEEQVGKILAAVVRPFSTVCLYVRGPGQDFFDELALIESLLLPKMLRYELNSPTDWQPGELGDLLFEWPAAEMDAIRQWFNSPAISIEGYAGGDDLLARLAALRLTSGNRLTFKDVLTVADRAFRLWQDYDGLFLFSLAPIAGEIRASLS